MCIPFPLEWFLHSKTHHGPGFPNKGSSRPRLIDKPFSKSFCKPEGPECSNQSDLKQCICWVLTVYRALSCILHILNPERGALGTCSHVCAAFFFLTDEEAKAQRTIRVTQGHSRRVVPPPALQHQNRVLKSGGAFPANRHLMRQMLQTNGLNVIMGPCGCR